MRLLIDAVTVRSPGGKNLQLELTRCAAEQCQAGSEVILLRSPGSRDDDGQGPLRIEQVPCPRGGWLGVWAWTNWALPRKLEKLGANVVYGLNGLVSASAARLCGNIATVNNMVPFTPPPGRHAPLVSGGRFRLVLQRQAYVRSLRRAHAVVLHSQHALKTVSAFAGEIAHKTTVVLTGAPRTFKFDTSRVPAHPYGGVPYLLYLSAFLPYKNHLNLIEAYRRKIGAQVDLPDLLMAGFPTDAAYLVRVEEAIRRAGSPRRSRRSTSRTSVTSHLRAAMGHLRVGVPGEQSPMWLRSARDPAAALWGWLSMGDPGWLSIG